MSCDMATLHYSSREPSFWYSMYEYLQSCSSSHHLLFTLSPPPLSKQIEFGKNTASYLEIILSITTAHNEVGQVSIERTAGPERFH